ncbi:MAG: hypothetical protein H6855_00680 [Rhodospirillales bacterium]|nr:hypothetical protein [Rhodospirillales bacterium]MCB9964584.1 hypothetical protein [Rhodospirillales bacterium]MCB9973893.1 hypothetical protein [Rhodospirillales bacterium]MCB9980518.1 hypothetical protein [Rhodospirillales bacterium]
MGNESERPAKIETCAEDISARLTDLRDFVENYSQPTSGKSPLRATPGFNTCNTCLIETRANAWEAVGIPLRKSVTAAYPAATAPSAPIENAADIKRALRDVADYLGGSDKSRLKEIFDIPGGNDSRIDQLCNLSQNSAAALETLTKVRAMNLSAGSPLSQQPAHAPMTAIAALYNPQLRR